MGLLIMHMVRPRSTWLPALITGLFILLAGSLAAVRAELPQKPNILFILTDDQGWPTLSCYGNKLVPTPHLDSLARDGVRFSDAYVLPQCTPTRAAFLTGQHTARNRMWHVIPWYGTPWAPVREPMYRENLPRETFTVAKGLKAAGYTTGIIGKWHLTTNGDGDYVKLKQEAAAHYGFDFSAEPGQGSQNEGDKHVDYFTDQAIAFIERNREEPWFLYLSHHTIHNVVAAPDPLVAKYREKGAPAEGLNNATYLAAIEHLDNATGRLLENLDKLGLRERTLVVFLSDNGGADSIYDIEPFTKGAGTERQLKVAKSEFDNAPLREGKGSAYEGGIRVPMIVRGPGVKPGVVSDTPVHVVDLLPTFLEVAGAKAPEDHPVDGVSLLPLLHGEGSFPERALPFYMPLYDLRWAATPCAVLRRGDWKLIEFFGDWFDPAGRYVPGHRTELFNLREDLGEKNDLAGKMPEKTAQLLEELHAWIESQGAEIPGPNPNHDPQRALKETKVKPQLH